MSIEDETDRLDMLDDWDEVIFTPDDSYPTRTDKTIKINGIFDREYIELNGMESFKPVFVGSTSDLENAKHKKGNSMIEFNSTKYKVVDVEPDGTGITMLRLQEN